MNNMIAEPSRLLGILTKRRFLPLFIAQFFETFNDNLLKTALVVLITYDLSHSAHHAISLVAMTSVVIMLPYIFSPIAGQLADKYEKSNLVWIIKIIEFAAMFFASIGFIYNSVAILMLALFIMGAHSAFFSPVKYALLPQQLHPKELVAANAWFESGLFVAILLGTLFGGLLIKYPSGQYLVSYLGMGTATIGLMASFFVPRAAAMDPNLRINPNIFVETFLSIRKAKRNDDIWIAVLGVSWFWFIGVSLLNLLPGFTKHVLHAESTVFTLLLAILSIGITAGAIAVQWLLKGETSFRYIPFGIFGVSIFAMMLGVSYPTTHHFGELLTLQAFVHQSHNWLALVAVFFMAFFASMFAVPLHAVMQVAADDTHRSRIIAASNSVSAFFTVFASVLIEVLNSMRVSISTMWILLGICNALVFLSMVRVLAESFLKTFIKWALKSLYRVEIRGLENYYKIKDKAVIISNHVSYLDGMLLCAFLPDKISFAINTYVADTWYISPFIEAANGIRLDSTNPMSIKTLIKELCIRKKCIIFPEGRITSTGRLMKVYEGPALVADKCDAEILPIRLDGVQFSFFASLKDVFKRKMFPKITITIMPPKKLECDPEITGSKRREYLGMYLYDMMQEMMFDSSNYQDNLIQSLLDSAKKYGRHTCILEDSSMGSATYSNLIKRIYAFANALPDPEKHEEPALLCSEPTIDFVVALFALQLKGYLPIMLNDLRDDALLRATQQKTKATLTIMSQDFIRQHAELLEDFESNHMLLDDSYYSALPSYPKARLYLQKNLAAIKVSDPAWALFSKKADGEVHGVIVTHENIQATRFQLLICLDLNPNDTVFNAYHNYHIFSLVAGMIMPMLSNIKVHLHPAYIQTHRVPKLIGNSAPTLLMADPEDLFRFGEEAYPYELISLRYVFADGESMSEELKHLWLHKFGLRILSGLLSQDISPIYAMNTAMQHKPNTLGRMLPKIKYKIESDDASQGGRLYVAGPNVMRDWDSDADLESREWYDTGKYVTVDEHGFMQIVTN